MNKLTLSLVLVVVTAVVGLGWLIGELYSRVNSVAPELDDRIAGYQTMGKGLAQALSNSNDRDALIKHWTNEKDLIVTLEERASFSLPASLEQRFDDGHPLVLESDGEVSLHFRIGESEQVLSLTLPVEAASRSLATTNMVLTILFYVGVVAIILVWLYPLVRRLVHLRKTAKAFGQGDLSARVTTRNTSYIADIEHEFNRMAGRIQALISDNKLLSHAVSHELKTPLARLRFGLDTLVEASNEQARAKYAQRINKDLCEMESLVEALLDYARLDTPDIKLRKEKIDLKLFVSRLFNDLDHPNINVLYNITDVDTFIYADEDYLAIQLNNVMSNAIIHANHAIRVSITSTKGTTSITIEDDGAGIPAEERDQVVKPFWRAKNNTNPNGHGMGLAVVSRLAKWLDAELSICSSAELGGASVRLSYASA